MDLCRASQSSREQVKTEMAEQAVKKKKKKRSNNGGKRNYYAKCCTSETKKKVHTVDEGPDKFFVDVVQAPHAEKEEWIVPVLVKF